MCLTDASVGWTPEERPLSNNINETARTYIITGQSIPCDGQVTDWYFWVANNTGPLGMIIWRPVDDVTYEVVGYDVLQNVSEGYNEVNLMEEAFINVKMGDVLGKYDLIFHPLTPTLLSLFRRMTVKDIMKLI